MKQATPHPSSPRNCILRCSGVGSDTAGLPACDRSNGSVSELGVPWLSRLPFSKKAVEGGTVYVFFFEKKKREESIRYDAVALLVLLLVNQHR